jgi:hypothetical protein
MSDNPQIQRPIPRRPFDLHSELSTPTSPTGDYLDAYQSDADAGPVKRSRSAVSLTASTLFGIYGKTYSDESATPSFLTRNNSSADLKPMTPLSTRLDNNQRPIKNPAASPLTLLFRVFSLFVFGVAYGVIITHLHSGADVRLAINRWSTSYLAFWGLAGVGLGSVLPWLDGKDSPTTPSSSSVRSKRDWSPAVRSIGAFVGIAYAIVCPPPPPGASVW